MASLGHFVDRLENSDEFFNLTRDERPHRDEVSIENYLISALDYFEKGDFYTGFKALCYAWDLHIPPNECVACGRVERFDDCGECFCGRHRHRLHDYNYIQYNHIPDGF